MVKKTVKKKTSAKKNDRSSVSKKQVSALTGKTGLIGIIIIILVAVAVALLVPESSDDASIVNRGVVLSNNAPVSTADVVLDMYVMSQCPYGVQAENGAIPAVQRFGGDVKYNIHYIVSSSGNTFQSLHGQSEVDEDIRQLCIDKYYPELFLDYLLCFNKNYRAGESSYEACAAELGIDTSKIGECFENGEGVELLKASEAQTQEVGATGSPTIYLDGESYGSGRTELDFARAICDKLDYDNEGCTDIPKPVEVKVTILTDDDCPSCDTANTIAVTKQLFPGSEFETVDIDSSEGQALLEANNLTYLPVFFFDSSLAETNTWNTNTPIQASFLETEDGFRLRDEAIGASWFIDEQKQAEFFASIGVVKGDNRPQIDFFVMSFCPYGNLAEEAIYPVYQQLKDKADFNPKYVIYSNYGSGYPDYCLDEESTLCSMHGIQELNQDIREACVAKNIGMDEWFEFAMAMNDQCTSGNADTCWTGVAEGLGLDTEAISTCEAEEGYNLLLADKTLGDKLGVRGSPSVFIDGMAYSGSRTANGYLAGLCDAFENAPSECAGVLAEPTQAAVPSGSC